MVKKLNHFLLPLILDDKNVSGSIGVSEKYRKDHFSIKNSWGKNMTDRERILHRPRHRRPVDIHVGARIHDRRRFLGLGRSDLARALGLSSSRSKNMKMAIQPFRRRAFTKSASNCASNPVIFLKIWNRNRTVFGPVSTQTDSTRQARPKCAGCPQSIARSRIRTYAIVFMLWPAPWPRARSANIRTMPQPEKGLPDKARMPSRGLKLPWIFASTQTWFR